MKEGIDWTRLLKSLVKLSPLRSATLVARIKPSRVALVLILLEEKGGCRQPKYLHGTSL